MRKCKILLLQANAGMVIPCVGKAFGLGVCLYAVKCVKGGRTPEVKTPPLTPTLN